MHCSVKRQKQGKLLNSEFSYFLQLLKKNNSSASLVLNLRNFSDIVFLTFNLLRATSFRLFSTFVFKIHNYSRKNMPILKKIPKTHYLKLLSPSSDYRKAFSKIFNSEKRLSINEVVTNYLRTLCRASLKSLISHLMGEKNLHLNYR